jgi:hypothetical protein
MGVSSGNICPHQDEKGIGRWDKEAITLPWRKLKNLIGWLVQNNAVLLAGIECVPDCEALFVHVAETRSLDVMDVFLRIQCGKGMKSKKMCSGRRFSDVHAKKPRKTSAIPP